MHELVMRGEGEGGGAAHRLLVSLCESESCGDNYKKQLLSFFSVWKFAHASLNGGGSFKRAGWKN